ncbi:MAG: adenylate/guanylate cyclase domain-containing protein [Desulfobacteraceae bacterium]|nr:adenylate/guanylate cyclase domain-containing protein [Desulfobacteraceae bacterium]
MKGNNSFPLLMQKYIFERPDKVDEKNHHVFILESVGVIFGFFTHLFWIFLFWYLGVKPLAIFNIFSVFIWLIVGILNRKGSHLSAILPCAFEVCLHQTLCVYFIGWDSGFQYYILILPTIIYLMPHGANFKKFITIVFVFLNYLLLYHFLKNAEPLFNLDSLIVNFFYYSNLSVFVLLICICCYFFNSQIYSAQKALKKEQHKVKEAYDLLSKYVPSQLKNTISNGRIESMSDHQRKKLTIFFSDIKDFTSMTDGMEPEDMASLLNEYLSEMDTIIFKHKGTLAQVTGDGLMIFFGAPEKTNDKDHALRCLYMAVDMQKKIKTFQKKWFDKGFDGSFKIRCGINTGMSTVGTFGSSRRKLYTAHGMQTNLAARLEQACEPGQILISHTTWALVKDKILCIEKGHITAKGYHKPLRAYEVDPSQRLYT